MKPPVRTRVLAKHPYLFITLKILFSVIQDYE